MSTTPYNLARFDFVSIRLAVRCAQRGSLTAAAADCHLVAPAASRRLRDLEAALGGALFERHSRGLVPTALGRAFTARGLIILQELDRLHGDLEDAHRGIARHLRLCSCTAALTQFLPPLLSRYAKVQPGLQVDLEEQVSAQVVHALREGRADLGIFVQGPDTQGLAVCEFRRDELVLLLPTHHRLAGEGPLDFADALDEPWISLNPGSAVLAALQQAALSAARPLRLFSQVRSFEALGPMVAAGLGLAVLPRLLAEPMARHLGLSWRPLSADWARRQLLIGCAPQADAAVLALQDFLRAPSHFAQADAATFTST